MKRLLLLLAILFTGVLAHSQEVEYKASFTLNFRSEERRVGKECRL